MAFRKIQNAALPQETVHYSDDRLFLLFYFALPILTSYTDVLNHPAIGPITWAWVFAFAQFVMTWVLCILYSRKAAQFDRMVDDIKKDMGA